MRVVGVLDLLGDRAVHARGGQRSLYEPVVMVAGEPIQPGHAPGLARAYVDRLGLDEIYVADLTAVSVVREMGPLMTAILVAGRSGSSIAAEIATMQVSEEIDGLKVMGMDPIEFLAVPRLLALVVVMPLLTVLADVVGIFGGFLVGVYYLDLSAQSFLHQAIGALSPFDLVTGSIKAIAFAYGIGLIGLYYGIRVRGGASEVGRTTTASVVASIFYIIVADCFFSVVFYILI